MSIHDPVGLADLPKTEVVAPPDQHSIESGNQVLGVFVQPSPLGLLADGLVDTTDGLLRRAGADVGPSRPGRVAATDGVSQEVKSTLRYRADGCLGLVDRQLELSHHGLHHAVGYYRCLDSYRMHHRYHHCRHLSGLS